MVIIGAGGLGIEVLLVLLEDNYQGEICFFDENVTLSKKIYDRFNIISKIEKLENQFNEISPCFVTAIGNPRIRKKITEKILKIGGKPHSVISSKASIFKFNKTFEGGIIQPGVGISHGVEIGNFSAIHINSTIGHSTKIGEFVNVGPGATIIGPVNIGDFTYVGAQSIIMPNLKIGKNVIIGAGSKVTKDIPDYGEWIDK